jgi:inosine-uridine nucleoside N-ribohydrolase
MFSTRRRFLKFLPVSALSALSVTSGPRLWGQNKPSASGTELRPVIVDADTANEVDDLFAIVRALIEPSFHVMGLTSAQWHTQDRAPNDTVGLSQKLNEDLLHLLDKNVPHPAGSNIPLVNPQRPQPSAAARHIISEAMKLPNGQKLTVFVLGPCTNLASAILMEPAIIPKIACYFIGFWHDIRQGAWSKREFNSRNDPNAVNVLLDTVGLEFHVMTATAAQALVFEKNVVDVHLKGKGGAADFLLDRWENYDRFWQKDDPEKKRWIMWDVALIEAVADPSITEAKQVDTPHDNRLRTISAFVKIDVVAMQTNYWRSLDGFFRGI